MVQLENFFPESVAATYDDSQGPEFEPETVAATAGFLAELAGDGSALELAVGTGRIALPLAERGVPVHGIDLSQPMVDRLRAKPGGDEIGVTMGDFATTRVAGMEGAFSVVYLVFNTIMNLTTQDAQVDCFRNAAVHLAPGGCFVVEVMVPDLRRLPPGQNIVPLHASSAGWGYDIYNVATQKMSSNYVEVADGRGEFWSIPFRYAWPAELDLMARIAGLRLRGRWDGWAGEPFTSESRKHVSVWEKPTG
jgi:SAM-dependent methyltransferase